MAKRTVLELVQDILREKGGDEVNSISDTIESSDVAGVLRQVFWEIVDEHSLPSTQELKALEGLGDTDLPNVMRIPEDDWNIKWIKYDNRIEVSGNHSYADISYMAPYDFVSMVANNPSTDTTNYQVVTINNIPLVINKTAGPQYWTSFDDEFIVFDSFNQDVDSTLQTSKVIVLVESRPNLILADDTVPDLPHNLENLLYIKTLNRVNKDNINPKLEDREHKMTIRSQRNKWRQGKQTDTGPDYGRK